MNCISRTKETLHINKLLSDIKCSTIIVLGRSGVGKTTIVNHCIEANRLSDSTLRFEFGDDFSSLKDFLNNTLVHNFGKSRFLDRILNRSWKLEGATITSIPGLSVTVFNKDCSSQPSSKKGVVFSSSTMRLNGEHHIAFFDKLWACATKAGCRVIYLSAAELASDEELQIIDLLVQTKPKDLKLIIEKAILKDKTLVDDPLTRRLSNLITTGISTVSVEPFDYASAVEFHNEMSRERRLTPFNFSENCGYPLAILHGCEYSDGTLDISAKVDEISELYEDQNFIVDLSIIIDHCSQKDRVLWALKELGHTSSFEPLERSGLIRITEDEVKYSHFLIRNFFAKNLFLKKSTRSEAVCDILAYKDEELRYRILFEYCDKYRSFDLKEAESSLLPLFYELLDEHNFKSIGDLLEYIDRKSFSFPKNVQIVLHIVRQQIQVFSHQSFSKNSPLALPEIAELVVSILEIQHNYQKGNYKSVIVDAENIADEYSQVASITPLLFNYLASALWGLKGIALSYIGDFVGAKKLIAEARNIAPPSSSISKYFKLYDSFLLEMAPVAAQDIVDVSFSSSPYLRAKINHNILTAKLFFTANDPTIYQKFQTHVIAQFAAGNCREITFSILNMGVWLLNQKRYLEAEETFSLALDRAFDLHEAAILFSNLSICAAMQNEAETAKIYKQKSISEMKRHDVFDPAISSRILINAAWIERIQGFEDKARELLLELNLPLGMRARDLLKKKASDVLQSSAEKLNETVISNDFQKHGIFIPITLNFWDFHFPIVNREILLQISENLGDQW